jgi:hypothetical protein
MGRLVCSIVARLSLDEPRPGRTTLLQSSAPRERSDTCMLAALAYEASPSKAVEMMICPPLLCRACPRLSSLKSILGCTLSYLMNE